jgi:rod shape determining protein RodA
MTLLAATLLTGLPKGLSRWTNWLLVLSAILLGVLGIVCIWSAGRYSPLVEDAWKKQLVVGIMGIGVCLLVQSVGYEAIGKAAWGLHVVSLALLLYTLMPFVPERGFLGVPRVNGAKCWIDLGIFRVQPAELVKITYVLTMARYLRFRTNFRTGAGLLVPFALTLGPMVLILKQPDLGMVLSFLPILFAMLFAGGAKLRHLMIVIVLGLLAAPMIWLCGSKGTPVFENLPEIVKPYQRQRVYSMFRDDPKNQREFGYQQHGALTAIGSGGLLGKPWGRLEVAPRVPESQNDMIMAVVGEQFGLTGCATVLLCYALIFLAGIDIAGDSKDPFARLTATGLIAAIAATALLNLLVVLRLCPVTGITLPLVSAGGSSLLAASVAIGLLLSISARRTLILGKTNFRE